jgi:ABC-type multidrug transport system fused ATPase/permease subunit
MCLRKHNRSDGIDSKSLLDQSTTTKSAADPDATSWLSYFLFFYIYPVLAHGARAGRLLLADIPILSRFDEPATAVIGFVRHSQAGKRRKGILSTLHALYAAPYYYSGALLLFTNIAALFGPIILNMLLQALSDNQQGKPHPSWYPYILALALFGSSAGQALTIHQFWWQAARVGLHSQFVLTERVFAKALALPNEAKTALSDAHSDKEVEAGKSDKAGSAPDAGGLSRGKLMNHM